MRRFAILLVLFQLSACDDGGRSESWRDLGELPASAATELNHTPMVVSGNRVLVGTSDGVWARQLEGTDEWTQTGLAGISIFATRRHPTIEATVLAAGQAVGDPQAPPVYRSDDGGDAWVPGATFPRNSFDQSSEPFFDLAIAPDVPDRLYANLSGPSVAISTDGGLNWALANGETDVFFGDACVIHILDSEPGTLYQGCEAPLDNAWIATQDIDPANPFTLSNLTFVAGGPDFALENRRPNGLASGPARPGTLYAGLEGSLIALDDSGFDFAFRAEEGSEDPPYVYVAAIWLDPDDPDRFVFGGGINGENTELALFETRDHGETIRRIRLPDELTDPSVEQIVPAGDDDLAVLISHVDEIGAASRRLTLYLVEGLR